MALSIDFAFEGFRIIRERPVLIAWWGAVLLIGVFASSALIMSVAGPEWNQFMQGQAPKTPEEMLPVMTKLLPVLLLSTLISLSFVAIISCAVYRAVLGGYSPKFGFLRLGQDEVRQVALMVVLGIVVITVTFCVAIILSVVGGLLGFIAGALEASLMPIIGVLTAVAAGVFNIWLMVNLSMVSVQSFSEGRFNLTGSIALTRTHFWRLLGGYALAGIMAFSVSFLLVVVYNGVATAISGVPVDTLDKVPRPDVSSLDKMWEPLNLAYMLTRGVTAPLTTAILIGAVAAAYVRLSGHTAQKAA